MSQSANKVNIRPKVSILSVLKYLEYESWYALAEFVDNSIASYLNYRDELHEVEGDDFKLEVKIEINEVENKITIRDNAAGIHEAEFPRAFRAAEAPLDKSGLSEFGMGMKSAACWFADDWTVTTKALNEKKQKTVNFSLNDIVHDSLEELDVYIENSPAHEHYTCIELFNVSKMPRKKGLTKVKEHLRSIYRDFIRRGILILKVNNDSLTYKEPPILNAPRYDDPKGEPVFWCGDINFSIDENIKVTGFVAIREKASTSEAGFALFRRGRVIEGSYDNGFRPEYIFGNPNSFRYQRVFGELHLEGIEVSFTKKGIKWDENLDIFLRRLREELTHEGFPLLQQAEKYRVRATEGEYKKAKKALDETVNDLKLKAEQAVNAARQSPPLKVDNNSKLTITEKVLNRDFEIRANKVTWQISIELSYEPSLNDLIEIGDHLINKKVNDKSVRQIGIRLSLTHPFMVQYVGVDNTRIEPVLRIVAALGLSEVIAKESGAKTQGEVRRNFNDLIYNLSKLN